MSSRWLFFPSPCRYQTSVTNLAGLPCQKSWQLWNFVSAFRCGMCYLQLAAPAECNCEDRICIVFVKLVSKVMRGMTGLHGLGTVIHKCHISCSCGYKPRVQEQCWTCRTVTLCDISCALQSEPWGPKQCCVTSFLFFQYVHSLIAVTKKL